MDVSELLLNDDSGCGDDDLPATQMVDDRVLKGVTAYVEVRSSSDNRSEAIRRELVQLGASIEKKFTNDVTHVIFKEGSNRTKSKAQKKGIHLVSVLWVENCKLNQEHVSERMYPAVVPRLTGTPLLMTKLKKAKSMQPKDFEEELANSAERVRRKRKKLTALSSLRGSESTPSNSPYLGAILVQDTQPHSQVSEEGFVFTPVRLTIPDTPPSMREKLKQLRLAKAEASGSFTNSDFEDDLDQRELNFKQLQKKLFNRRSLDDGDCSVTFESPNDISSILSEDNEDESITNDNENLPDGHCESNTNGEESEVFNLSVRSESSVNNDILSIAKNINATLNSPSQKAIPRLFGLDSDENLLSSQEIKTVADVIVKMKPSNDDVTKPSIKQTDEINNVNTNAENARRGVSNKANTSTAMSKKEVDTSSNQRTTRRSSKRLSVQQALQTLNQSGLLDSVPEHDDEDEDPLPKPCRENETMSTDVDDKISLDVPSKRKSGQNNGRSAKSRKNNRSSSVGDESCIHKQIKRRSRESNVKHRKDVKNSEDSNENQTLSVGNNVRNKSCDNQCIKQEQSVDSVEDKKVSNTSKGKKTMKKKLMSLTDLYEQHSVLVEPSTCSNIDRPQLMEKSIDKPTRKGRRRKSDKLNTSDKQDNEVINANKDKTISKLNETDRSRRGRKRKSSDNCLNDSENAESERKKPKRGRRKTNAGRSSTLVNDTHMEQTSPMTKPAGLDCSDAPVTKIQDVSTQLNLTKDNSLVCSIRETTLSLSMSTAYTDANMPSFLASQRRSIDEFSASQKRKKQKLAEKSVLSSICESMCTDHNRSGSDTSSIDGVVNKKMKRSRSGKLFRPSVVMTSLHSCEQDVVISVVKKLGGFIIAENVNETTTHVICGEPRRTLNVIRCLARGIWLVTKEWVITSLEKGKWVPEHDFENTSLFPTCKIARLERERCNGMYTQALFSKVGPIYVSGQSRPPRSHLVQLIKLCGGQVINIKEKASLYVGSDFHPGMTCVKTIWLLDSITNHVQMPMDMYYLDRPKRESSPEY